MRSVQTSVTFPLASVKPLERLAEYRDYCVAATRRALREARRRRGRSPVGGAPLAAYGAVDGLQYVRCPETGSLFLEEVSDDAAWQRLLAEVSRARHAPDGFHARIAGPRHETVYGPKLEWILETLDLHGVRSPRMLEVTTAPSDFTALLQASGRCARVVTVDEMTLSPATGEGPDRLMAEAAVALESLDRVTEPETLVRRLVERLAPGGLLFVTALVSSGFDFAVLGLRNRYLYPPDRTNCFSLSGLKRLLTGAGLALIEVSTPGVLDVEIVQAHVAQDPAIPLSAFERQLITAEEDTRLAFQAFLQQQGASSFARIVARKGP